MRNAAIVVLLAAVGLAGFFLWSHNTPQRVAARPTPVTPKLESRQALRFAMTAAFVSDDGVGIYEEIVRHVESKLGRRCELVKGMSYRTVGAMLRDGAIDVAFVCGLPYVNDVDAPEPPIALIAAPVMRDPKYEGRPKYFSYVIVRNDSAYTDFESLRGCVFAYNDELSNSGYNMPRARLIELGVKGDFFRTMKRSGSHEASIRMVASGDADASCVDSLVLDYERNRKAPTALAVKIIGTLGPAGIPPIVASTRLPSELRDELTRILTTMHDDSDGRAILERGLLARFVRVNDDNYDDIRTMKKAAESRGYLEIR